MIALAWPGPTALVLVLIVGVWAIVAGLVEIGAAFGNGKEPDAGDRDADRSRIRYNQYRY